MKKKATLHTLEPNPMVNSVKTSEEAIAEGGIYVCLPVKPEHREGHDGIVAGSTKERCQVCDAEVWMAPSGKPLQAMDTAGRVPAMCIDCALTSIRQDES